MNEDDLPGSPLWDALLGPGTHDELAGEGAALAAFRAAQPSRGRGARRLGVVGGAGVAIFLAAGAGVAAAYTGNLPGPFQDAVHKVAGGIGVPAPPKGRPEAASHHTTPVPNATRTSKPGDVVVPLPGSGPSPTAGPPATPAPAVSAQPSAPTSRVPAVSATGQPSSQPSTTASPSPAAKPTLTAALSATTVTMHRDVVVSGRLVRGDKPMVGRTVYLAREYPGQDGWTRIGQGTTDAQGRVQITASSLNRNVLLRLAGGGVVSGNHKVTVLPTVNVKVTVPAAGKRRLAVTTDGAVAGDSCQLMRLDGTTWTFVASHSLDASAATAFTVPAAPSGTRVRYRIRVLATSRHGLGQHIQTLSSP